MMKMTVLAGPHTRCACPVSLPVPADEIKAVLNGAEELLAKPVNGGEPIKCAVRFDGEQAFVEFVLDFLAKNEGAEFELVPSEHCAPRMRCEKTERGVSIFDGSLRLAEYYTGTDIPKPYLGPICERYGNQITRLDFETQEHPHHRAIWVSHGDVNGVDTWNEPENKHGFIRNKEICGIYNSSVCTGFTAKNVWTEHGGKPLCSETTEYKFYSCPPEFTIIDMKITLSADFGEVKLGATKEAGPLAVRMAESIKVKNTGTMANGVGGINEQEIWMKRAPWVDYYGVAGGHVSGIAIFDNPENDMYPTYWHARNYGLLAVNNFYIGGEKIIPEGGSMTWKFRIIAHNGDTQEAGIAGRFMDYFAPPVAKAE
jgi:hypothetical protein